MRTVNSSNLPISIKKEHHHFPSGGRISKLFTGPSAPKAGPIFPREEAAPPIAVSKSSPNPPKITDPIIKESI